MKRGSPAMVEKGNEMGLDWVSILGLKSLDPLVGTTFTKSIEGFCADKSSHTRGRCLFSGHG